MKKRAPALPDSATFEQLWEAFGRRLAEAVHEGVFYT